MSPLRLFALLLGTALALATSAAAADLVRPHHLKKKGHHWHGHVEAGDPGPGPAVSPRARKTRVEILGHTDPGGTAPFGDVVAHHGYAYMGSWGIFQPDGEFCPGEGVRVFDLDNPRRPRHVSTFADARNPRLAGSWTEKVIVRSLHNKWFRGDLATVSFQDCEDNGFRGIGLYDVSNPRRPRELALYENGIFGVHELWLEVRGDKAYVYEAALFEEFAAAVEGGSPDGLNPDFRVIDVTNPRRPEQIGSWGAWEELGISPLAGLGTFSANYVHSVVVFDKIAYVSYWDLGTVMLDVRNPARPRFIGRTEFEAGAEGNAHSAWVADRRDLLIQADEDFDPTPNPDVETGWGYGHIFDISNPRRPKELSRIKLPSTSQFPPPGPGDFTIHDPKVVGDTLYASWYTEGVLLFDIDRPRRPGFVAQFLPPFAEEDPFGVFYPGEEFVEIWGVYPYRGYVLASDMNTGLWVFDTKTRHRH